MKDVSSIIVLIAIVFFIAVILIYIFYFRVTPTDIPEFSRAWVVTQAPGDPFASNEPRLVTKDTIVKLHAVIATKKKDSNDITYFTNAQQLRLDGEEIPYEQIERWPKQWGSVKIIWSRVEPMIGSYTTSTQSEGKVLFRENYADKWPFYWEVEADVNIPKEEPPPGITLPEPSEFEEFQLDLGTMRYTLFAVLYWGENRFTPIRKAHSPGPDSSDDYGITDEVTRLSVREDFSFIGTLRALHNLPYIKYPEPDDKRMYRIEHLVGFDSVGAIMATLMLMGYKDLGNYDLDALKELTTTLHEDVYLAQDNLYYPTRKATQKIPFGPNGVKVGDIIQSGDHVGVITRDIGPEGLPNGVLDYADAVLHCYDAPLKEDYISQAFLSTFSILRLQEKS